MSEEELKKLKEFVFRDIRMGGGKTGSYKQVVKEELKQTDNPVEKVELYQHRMGDKDKYNHKKPDAERWEIARESYRNYPGFWDKEHSERENFIYYKDIKITADILTSPSEIIECANGLDKQNKKLQTALKTFCSVVYTVGNCCPAMFNPIPKHSSVNLPADTCWFKLQRFIDPKQDEYKSFYDYPWNKVLNRRGKTKNTKDNMFLVFPEKHSGQEIIERLVLQDYCTPEYLELSSPEDYAGSCADYVDFLNRITLPIIKRGIRIYCGNNLRIIHLNERGLTGFAEKLIEERKKELGIQ